MEMEGFVFSFRFFLPDRGRLAGFAGMALALPLVVAASGEWESRPSATSFELEGFEEGKDLSGLARSGNTVLVATDETTRVQLGLLDAVAGVIRKSATVRLLPAEGKGDEDDEIDTEAACHAEAEGAFYVVGSHGVGKKKGDVQPLRFGVYRIPFDAGKGSVVDSGIERSSLLPWLESESEFRDRMRRPLQQGGFNIEGLAHVGGVLFFGVRSPSIAGRAFVIEVKAEELFRDSGRGIRPKVHPVELGPDRGIRDIAAVRGGFLLLSGNAAAEPSKKFPVSEGWKEDEIFTLDFLPAAGPGPFGEPERIADVTEPGGKAEGLLVLSDAEDALEVLIVHDERDQGGATTWTLRRPAKSAAGAATESSPPQ